MRARPKDHVTPVTARLADVAEPCCWCLELAKVFFSYNPEAVPDTCADCFAELEADEWADPKGDQESR